MNATRDPDGRPGSESVDERLDRLVSVYSDRRAAGDDPRAAELLGQVPAGEPREALARCFRMIDAGLAQVPGSGAALGPGTVVGDDYEIVRKVGAGAMSTVFEALDRSLDRRVALKVLRPGLATEPRHVERFRREAMAIARLAHANIVDVYRVGEDRGHHYIAMEFVDGPDLATALSRLPDDREPTAADVAAALAMPQLAEVCTTAEQALAAVLAPVAHALQEAHALGILHRDLKPSNILVHPAGRPVVADFGLARADDTPALSLTGEPIGTPYYMSPEQVAQSEALLDARTDVYSLGVTLYEALTGERPFRGDTVLAVFDAIRATTPPDVRSLRPNASPDAAAVVRRAMARTPDERYASAAEFAADLEALATGAPTVARSREGGPLRRAWTSLRRLSRGEVVDYTSPRRVFGMPLLHVHLGPRGGQRPGPRLRRAHGFFAIGDIATGVFALGNVTAAGVVALAGVAPVGLVAIGGAAAVAGLFACAGAAAVGSVAFAGGGAVGGLAIGGSAAGYAAVGGAAAGYIACGGAVSGVHTIGPEGVDAVARDWFEAWTPWLYDWLIAPIVDQHGETGR